MGLLRTKEVRDFVTDDNLKMKIFVAVVMFQGVIDDIAIFSEESKADVWFKEKTGYTLEELDAFYEIGRDTDFDGSTIWMLTEIDREE